MSEPVAWLIPGCITRDKELAEVNKAYAEPLYLNPDPRVAELEAVLRECRDEMKMKYTEQAVETLDDAGSVIANKNIEIEQLRQRVAELEENWRLSEIASAKRQMNVIKLTAERDALKQQRDVFLAALVDIQQVACSGSPELGIASDAIASVKERDELLAALEKFLDDNNPEGFGCACEPGRLCGPCSEAKRQRPLYAAIASVKDKQNGI